MTMILALMEAARGKILTRSSYSMHETLYCVDDHFMVDCDLIYDKLNPNKLPFIDEESLYENDWVYGKLTS